MQMILRLILNKTMGRMLVMRSRGFTELRCVETQRTTAEAGVIPDTSISLWSVFLANHMLFVQCQERLNASLNYAVTGST